MPWLPTDAFLLSCCLHSQPQLDSVQTNAAALRGNCKSLAVESSCRSPSQAHTDWEGCIHKMHEAQMKTKAKLKVEEKNPASPHKVCERKASRLSLPSAVSGVFREGEKCVKPRQEEYRRTSDMALRASYRLPQLFHDPLSSAAHPGSCLTHN